MSSKNAKDGAGSATESTKQVKWVCEVCNVAIFETYDEAWEHENHCKGAHDVIRDKYLSNFHKTCVPSTSKDTEERLLKGQLQRMNISGSNNYPSGILDVPVVTIKYVASFLGGPSRALFAVALSDNFSRRECKAIAGDQWSTLDFGAIEKTLAEKLADEDLRDVLLCINSVRTVNTLRLANCVNLTGVGLEPLRGSRVIEHIDLSLVPDHTSPLLDPEPPLSQDLVLPILSTIVGNGRLKLMEFPKAWRQNNERDFEAFENAAEFDPFNQLLELFELNMNRHCLECEDEIEPNFSNEAEGTQRFTCYECYDTYCEDCIYEHGSILFCERCERHFCHDCKHLKSCDICSSFYCEKCEPFIHCQRCDIFHCSDCIMKTSCKQCSKEIQKCRFCEWHYDNETNLFSGGEVRKCSYCPSDDNTYCTDCVDSALTSCDICDIDHCERHAQKEGLHICSDYEMSKNGDDSCVCKNCRVGSFYTFGCKFCYERYCPLLLRENEKLRKEIKRLESKLQEAADGFSVADVDMVMTQAGCTRALARKALKDHGNSVVDAILSFD